MEPRRHREPAQKRARLARPALAHTDGGSREFQQLPLRLWHTHGCVMYARTHARHRALHHTRHTPRSCDRGTRVRTLLRSPYCIVYRVPWLLLGVYRAMRLAPGT